MHNYFVRGRLLLEKIFNIEFRVGILDGSSERTESLFLIGK